MSKNFWLLSAGLAALATPRLCAGRAADHAAAAPSRPPPADAAEDDQNIVVTAQGRRQILQDVPLAVTAVGGESLQNSRRERHPPAQPARPVAARLLDRHRGERLGPYPRHRHGRRQSRPRKLGRGVHRRRLPLALAASASTSSARSSGSRCCAARRAPCSAATPRPASSTSSPSRPNFEFGGYGRADLRQLRLYPRRRRRSPARSASTLAFRLDARLCPPRRLLRRRQPDRRHRERVNDRDRFFVRGQLLFEPNDALSIRLIGDYTQPRGILLRRRLSRPRDTARSAT